MTTKIKEILKKLAPLNQKYLIREKLEGIEVLLLDGSEFGVYDLEELIKIKKELCSENNFFVGLRTKIDTDLDRVWMRFF